MRLLLIVFRESFNVINEQVKKIISGIFKSDKWNVNFNSSVYNRNVIDQGTLNLGSNVNASIGRSLFNNRVIFTASGSVEGLLQSGTVQQSVQFLPDLVIEILLNRSGTFRAVLFYKENIDYLTTNISSKTQKERVSDFLTGKILISSATFSEERKIKQFPTLLRKQIQQKKKILNWSNR